MSFGKRLLEARKKKGISQEDLAEQLGTKGPVIGRYERDEMKPSIEAAAKMADVLGISLDWLVGHTDLELDTAMLKRIQEVTKMQPKDKEHVFALLDAFIATTKMQNFLAK
jgi:transcriptional regulator with XRE-family HTH domain